MTISTLLEQFENLWDDGYFDVNNETDKDRSIDWLRTHFTEAIKSAVGKDDKDEPHKRTYSIYGKDEQGKRNGIRAEILQKLGINI